MMFRAEDIINADRVFAALQYAITECMHDMTGEDIQEMQRRLGAKQNIPGEIESPKMLRDIAAFHIDWIETGGDAKTRPYNCSYAMSAGRYCPVYHTCREQRGV